MPEQNKSSLKSTTALTPGGFNGWLMQTLIHGDSKNESVVETVIRKKGDAHWEQIKAGRAAMTVEELSDILKEMNVQGIGPDFADAAPRRKSPMNDQAFYDALAKNIESAEKLKKQLEDLRAEAKKNEGYVSKLFSIVSHKDPVGKAMSDVAEFEKYCHKNGVKYDAAAGSLAQSDKPRTKMDALVDSRFLLAAVGGAAIGLVGLNLGLLPVLGLAPAAFFGVLPWLAAPFIGLNIFKSFSQYSIMKEAPTLLRFAAITAAGFAISMGVTMGMTALLGVVNPATIAAAAIPGGAAGGFSPMQYMLPIIGVFTAAALAYKRAKATVAGAFNNPSDKPGMAGKLTNAYNKAVGLLVNKYTAPVMVKAGQLGEKATEVINKGFPKFIDVVGLPAVAVLMSATMATGGLGLLGAFAGYYITAFTGLAVGGAAMMAAFYQMGCRGKDFKELGSAAATGFSLSSSSATMPKEREALKAIGVSARTRDTVVPLGGVFNMYGTSLYMGLTAFYAMAMFNPAATLMNYVKTATTVMAIALGAPGIPASNITLLDPVLQQTGLVAAQIHKIYAMIIPADRILDMTQTALNVLGDMVAAVHPDRKRLRYRRAKNIKKLREIRLEKEKLLGRPSNDKAPAPQPAAPPVNNKAEGGNAPPAPEQEQQPATLAPTKPKKSLAL
jgi:hypothetical protein